MTNCSYGEQSKNELHYGCSHLRPFYRSGYCIVALSFLNQHARYIINFTVAIFGEKRSLLYSEKKRDQMWQLAQ